MLSALQLWIDNQILNNNEAVLINYFKPEYNQIYNNNFPAITHKGYRFYYDYDYNAVTVELDPSCVNIELFSKVRDSYSQYNPIKYNLHSEEERRSMFNMDFWEKGYQCLACGLLTPLTSAIVKVNSNVQY